MIVKNNISVNKQIFRNEFLNRLEKEYPHLFINGKLINMDNLPEYPRMAERWYNHAVDVYERKSEEIMKNNFQDYMIRLKEYRDYKNSVKTKISEILDIPLYKFLLPKKYGGVSLKEMLLSLV